MTLCSHVAINYSTLYPPYYRCVQDEYYICGTLKICSNGTGDSAGDLYGHVTVKDADDNVLLYAETFWESGIPHKVYFTGGWIESDEFIGGDRYFNIYQEPHYYLKTTGSDANDGTSWANAWATINKAAITVPDGSTVHIGHGTYNNEPSGNAIAPVNAGSLGIKYKPETADTGAEVAGSIIVEKNA